MEKSIPESAKFKIFKIARRISFPLIFLGLFLIASTYAYSAVWHVDGASGVDPAACPANTSWTTPAPLLTIQKAIDCAAAGDEIWVKAGTYNLTSSIDVIDVDKVVEVYGGFNGTETLRNQRDWATNVTTVDANNIVDKCFFVTANATIDGFTITGAAADLTNSGGGIFNMDCDPVIKNCTFSNNEEPLYGGGLANWNSSPLIDNCTFSGNRAEYGGAISNRGNSNANITNCTFSSSNYSYFGGGAIYNSGSTPTITNCTFTGNNTGAGRGAAIHNDNSSPDITNCIFSSNDADENGGAIYNNNSSPPITNCRFSANSTEGLGGAICNANSSSPTITGCVFLNNIGYGGGGGAIYNDASSPVITNSIFSANDGRDNGGAIHNLNSTPFITNCTFSKNVAATTSGQGGAIFNSGSSLTITNSILWGNIAANGPEIYNSGTATSTVTYCDVQGGYSGVGNIDENPLFLDAPNDDLHLTSGSPCIDAGTNSDPNLPAADIDGDDRIINGTVDLGADEFVVSDTTPPDPPVVIGDTPTNDATPTWSWTAGGGGNGTYQYQLDGEAGTWQTTTDTFFTPSGSLSDGPHILYVQETDDATNWSASGSSTILVDTISPTTFGHAPVDNQPNVAVNSNIVVHVLDSGSGVDIGSIAITVTEDGAAVSGSVDIPGTPSDYTVTFDPSSDFGNLASIEVTVEASDFAGNLMTDTYDFVTADVGGTSWDIADDDGDGILNSEEDLLGTSRTTKTIFVRPKERNEADDGWEYWPDFVQVLFPYAGKDGFADALALTDAGIEVVVIGAPTPYLPMQAFDYDPGDPAKNIDLNIDPTGTPIDFDPSTSNWQGPNCDILEIEYYPPETEKYCTVVGGCNKNFGHIYFTNNDDYGWDTKGITPNTSQHHGYYKPRLYGFAQQNYFEEAWFTQLQQDQLPQYETADPFPPGYLCNFSSNPADNQCYDFEPTHSSPLNLNLGDPTSGSPDDWVEFKPITFDATDKSIDCFDEDCDLTEPLAVTATQFDFSAVLRRTTLHEWSHAFLTATPGDHCDNENCILQVGVEDWTLHPFGTSCGHKAAIQGAVHNSRH